MLFAFVVLCSAWSPAHGQLPRWFRPAPIRHAIPALPMDLEAAGVNWELGPNLAVVRDDLLNQAVLEHTGGPNGWIRTRRPLTGSYEIVARVRVMQRGHGATLAIGVDGPDARPQKAYELMVRPSGERTWDVQTRRAAREHYLEDESLWADGPARRLHAADSIPGQVNLGERYTRAPSPLADEGYRREIEAALHARPAATGQWMELRIEYRPAALRMLVNGIPVGERRQAGNFNGDGYLHLDRSVRVASLEIHALDDAPPAYYPIALTEQLNARAVGTEGYWALRESALPPPNLDGLVESIPFRFALDQAKRDHVDVGKSIFRLRNRAGHFMSGGDALENITWPSPHQRDPGRIMFQVPNRAYSRLWLIAAADEQPFTVPVVTARFFRAGAGFPIERRAKCRSSRRAARPARPGACR
jgi:hypothetical protein